MFKKDFTSFDLHAIVYELKGKLLEARINNVYQLDEKTLLFKLHKMNEPPFQLVLEAGRRLHLTNYSLEKPPKPPAFCMTLRKYLPGGWITNIEQIKFERVVIIEIKTKEGIMKLILELFGEGNIILANAESTILQALFFKKMRDRNIVRNQAYQLPPSNAKNPFTITKEELEKELKTNSLEVVKTIVRTLGIGGVYAEELLLRAQIEKTAPGNMITIKETEAIYVALRELLLDFSSQKLKPMIIFDDKGSFIDVTPIMLHQYEKSRIQLYQSFNEALDEFFVHVTATQKAIAGIDTSQLKRETERLKRMLADQEKALSEENLKMASDKKVGDTIYGNFNELQILLEEFSNIWRQGKDLLELAHQVAEDKKSGKVPERFFESFDGKNLRINIRVNDLSISLNIRKSLYENAADYYDKGKQAKEKIVGIKAAMDDSKNKLTNIEKQLCKAEAQKTAAPAEAIEELTKRKVETKEWFEKFRWFISSENFLVVAGKDIVSNEVLIKKYADPYDIVFHADLVGSPFAVVKTEGKQPGEPTLKEASEFAASFSRAWRENMGSIDVYWVKPEQLSKSGPSGEFVPHGAFSVSGKRNWMRGTPLHLAIGIVENEEIEFIGGPINAIKAKTNICVIFFPGDLTGKDLLKQLLRSLTLKLPKEQREKMGKASIERIREFVPYTKGQIKIDS